jgi:signal peptidase I
METRVATKNRRVCAVILSLVIPGGGHFPLGRWRRGMLWFAAASAGVTLLVIGLNAGVPLMATLCLATLGIFGIRAFAAVDAARVAVRGTIPGWGIVVLACAALGALSTVNRWMVRRYAIEAFKIPAGSMIPTLQVGDHVFVDKTDHSARRGDVIVFKFPKDPSKSFIKRVIGIAGDTVEFRDGELYLNGEQVAAKSLDGPCTYSDIEEMTGEWQQRKCRSERETIDGRSWVILHEETPSHGSFKPVKVAPGHVYVLGDNRDNSHDSRYWGTVPPEDIQGRARVIWWSYGEPEGIRTARLMQSIE